ncbi:hypothetical protein CXG81DRAFT_24833 [Caulochytrium protostelioides]|uniref:Late embryogenesis abundant protein LEA-2 subgroup domain-containing protein n=1 Tax=Caulochytrium protostelioides TaxID=1555241 RepID=A0A4P9XAY5_9FUNG|nr:hypothetical protein CXG81DRAFT_24833 [Caulochytrium protostelioides]|eukprot:RKP02547.1 hypothetical protein CXG81DRAFT_24833 [Caulochytrium protostelioides]
MPYYDENRDTDSSAPASAYGRAPSYAPYGGYGAFGAADHALGPGKPVYAPAGGMRIPPPPPSDAYRSRYGGGGGHHMNRSPDSDDTYYPGDGRSGAMPAMPTTTKTTRTTTTAGPSSPSADAEAASAKQGWDLQGWAAWIKSPFTRKADAADTTPADEAADADGFDARPAPRGLNEYGQPAAWVYQERHAPPRPPPGVGVSRYPRYDAAANSGKGGGPPTHTYAADRQPYNPGWCRRCCCCCWPTSRRGKWTCSLLLVVILAGLGVFLYFLFPRIPTFRVDRVTADPESFEVLSASGSDTTIRLSLNMKLHIINDNMYPLDVKRINMTAQLEPDMEALTKAGMNPTATQKLQEQKTYPIGSGVIGAVRLPAYGAADVAMDFVITYTPVIQGSSIADPSLFEILDACALWGNHVARLMRVPYTADVEMGWLKAIGIETNPSLGHYFRVSCPLNEAQLQEVAGRLGPAVQHIMQQTNHKQVPAPADGDASNEAAPPPPASPSPSPSTSWQPTRTFTSTSAPSSATTHLRTAATRPANHLAVSVSDAAASVSDPDAFVANDTARARETGAMAPPTV